MIIKNNSKTHVGVILFQTNLKAALQLCSACGSFAYYKYPKDSDFFIITVNSVCIVSILLFTDDELSVDESTYKSTYELYKFGS